MTGFRLVIWAAILFVAVNAHAESPQNLYTLNCWGCHRPGGEGIPGTAPPLQNAVDFLRVPGGRSYLIQVPGVSQSSLSDADTALVMNWILANFQKRGTPQEFKPYTAAEIHEYRSTHLLDVTNTRKALIDKMVAMKIRSATDR